MERGIPESYVLQAITAKNTVFELVHGCSITNVTEKSFNLQKSSEYQAVVTIGLHIRLIPQHIQRLEALFRVLKVVHHLNPVDPAIDRIRLRKDSILKVCDGIE